jgi:hypothetical protein
MRDDLLLHVLGCNHDLQEELQELKTKKKKKKREIALLVCELIVIMHHMHGVRGQARKIKKNWLWEEKFDERLVCCCCCCWACTYRPRTSTVRTICQCNNIQTTGFFWVFFFVFFLVSHSRWRHGAAMPCQVRLKKKKKKPKKKMSDRVTVQQISHEKQDCLCIYLFTS